jgi:transcriptional regulator with XRE-family HTH domain|nr:MAG TPA: helix-turn-helix domain protein [Caudoviricetes sp.]
MGKGLVEMNNIQNLRKKAGISRTQLHKVTNIPLRTLEDWESQKNTPNQYHRIKAIADVFGCTEYEVMQFCTKARYGKIEYGILTMIDIEGNAVYIQFIDEDGTCRIESEVESGAAFDLYQRHKKEEIWDITDDPLFR